MAQISTQFNGLEIFFLICATLGGFLVVVKLILQFIGGGTETHLGGDAVPAFDGDHVDADIGFRLLSLHGLSSFFMIFGLVGLALYRQSQTGAPLSIAGAVAAGMMSVWVIGKLFALANGLQSSGNLHIDDAVGCTGTVYLSIAQGGSGRVSLNFNNRLREMDAVEKNGAAVPTGTPVRVVAVNANVLVVEILPAP